MKTFQLNNVIFFLVIVLFIGACTSEAQLVNTSSDATVTSMYFNSNDSSPNLSSAVFKINDIDSLIYNVDSLPYNTRIDSAVTNFTFSSSAGYIINDTIPKYSYDTITLDFTKPVKITNVASDKTSTMSYHIKVNVHKVQTYLHTWDKLNAEIQSNGQSKQKAVLMNGKFYYFSGSGVNNYLYSSSDATTWNAEKTPVGLPLGASLRDMVVFKNNIYLFHNGDELYSTSDAVNWTKAVFNDNYKFLTLLFSFQNKLWAIAQNKSDNSLHVANTDNGTNWAIIANSLPSNFPVTGFATTSFTPRMGLEKVLLVGGYNNNGEKLNTRWSSEDGSYWVNLQNSKSTFNAISGASLAYYGSKLLLIGGTDINNNLVAADLQLRQSLDEGLTWAKPDTTQNVLPADFKYRTETSVIVNSANKRLYIFGGHSNTDIFSDVWRIRVNFYDFLDYSSKY